MSDDSNKPASAAAPGGSMLYMRYMLRGGVVFSSDLALKLAELLCEAHYGKDELVRQRPFSVTDKDTYWRIEGSGNRGSKTEGTGALFMSIEKYDGRVADIGRWYDYQPGPAAMAIIKRQLARKKSDNAK